MKANKILFPTDFSEKSKNALAYAVNLAARMKGELIVFHSSHYPRYSSDISLDSIDREYEERFRQDESKLERIVGEVRDMNGDVPCRYILKHGMAADNIVSLVKDEHISLIVIGTGGNEAGNGFLPGSVTADLVEKASCPVFAIPANAAFKDFRRVMFASELSDADVPALCELSDFAKTFEADITVLNISDEDDADHYKRYEEFKDKVVNCLGYDRLEYEHGLNKNILKGISEYTSGHHPDALVMATHRRKGINKLLRPSITRKMALNTNVPLLALHV
ncbi:universal stress protein [Cytophagaceae bacterium ABcell3]|nr:universal stress protein [Cytophagaceae bacterium ABcell3]